jgi:hypothetical protein
VVIGVALRRLGLSSHLRRLGLDDVDVIEHVLPVRALVYLALR